MSIDKKHTIESEQEALDAFLSLYNSRIKSESAKTISECGTLWAAVQKATLAKISEYKEANQCNTQIQAIMEKISSSKSDKETYVLAACITDEDVTEFKQYVENGIKELKNNS